MAIELTEPVVHAEDQARESLESYRWPHGPYRRHRGSTNVLRLAGNAPRLWPANA